MRESADHNHEPKQPRDDQNRYSHIRRARLDLQQTYAKPDHLHTCRGGSFNSLETFQQLAVCPPEPTVTNEKCEKNPKDRKRRSHQRYDSSVRRL